MAREDVGGPTWRSPCRRFEPLEYKSQATDDACIGTCSGEGDGERRRSD